ncbi:hypothetical protein [Streptomyces griseorubiginosus]|uniref:hypothetical protein n=1 Tax=Streptomyces griseorubiginosus TaxID=67304 RepID=UPI0036E3CFE4
MSYPQRPEGNWQGGAPQQDDQRQYFLQSPQQSLPQLPRNRGILRKMLIVGACVVALAFVTLTSMLVYGKMTYHAPTDDEEYSYSVGRLFDELNTALKDKDEASFLAHFSGGAEDEQRKVFRNLVKIPFAVARFEPLREAAAAGYEDVVFVHQIEGVDVAPVYEQYTWKLNFNSESDSPFSVSEVRGSDAPWLGLEGTYYPAPWDVYDDMTVVKHGNLLVVSDKKYAQSTQRYAPYIFSAGAEDFSFWDEKGPADVFVAKGAVVILEPNRKIYDKFFSGEEENDSLEAGTTVSVPAYDSESKGRAQFGARVIMDSSLSRFTSSTWRDGVKRISRHEIAHAMLAHFSSPSTWLAEGFAEFMEFRGSTEAAQANDISLRGYPFRGLPPSGGDAFYSDDAQERAANYGLSRLAIQYMAEKYGESKALRFVAFSYSDPVNGEKYYKTLFGLEEDEFWSQWASWVRSQNPGIGS